ncbi:hypothetical protein BJY52DRAFT_1285927 [Lactarius psammicola]|nr:hypothetical protein BJY52DRAFT_1285927 [Lactarius psammicola]
MVQISVLPLLLSSLSILLRLASHPRCRLQPLPRPSSIPLLPEKGTIPMLPHLLIFLWDRFVASQQVLERLAHTRTLGPRTPLLQWKGSAPFSFCELATYCTVVSNISKSCPRWS